MIIGIDLGTTYSCAAYIKDGRPEVIMNTDGDKTTPSVVLFENEKNIVVGKNAKEQIIICPERIIATVKDYMGTDMRFTQFGKEYSPEEISAIILKKIIQDSEAAIGESVDGIVVTIPAYFTDTQRKATADACNLLAVPLISMINEPTAAALCYLNEKENTLKQTILAYDLGGGTFDVSIVEFNEGTSRVVATGGLRKVGGHSFDQLILNKIVEFIEETHNIDLYEDEYLDVLQELSIKAEKAKIQLSTAQKADVVLRIGKIKEKVTITRSEFESLIDKFYRRTESIVRRVLDDAGMAFSNIDKIILIGGSSRIPYIREQLKLLSGIEPSSDINPDEAVCMGAAIHANSTGKFKISDVCSHSLGIVLTQNVNSVIIRRNTLLPTVCERKYVIPEDGLSSIVIVLTEGEGENIEYVNQFATFEIDIPPQTEKGTQVVVHFELDENQILGVRTTVMTKPIIEKQVKIDRKSNLKLEELLTKKSALAQAVVE